jgi:glycosyltransferase involved in cell wall biosynthesis
MTTLAVVLFCLLAVSIGVQVLMAFGLWTALLRAKRPTTPDAACPKAVVIVCLRGLDPFLERCLHALLEQDYPRYDVRIVVDGPDDPAWRALEAISIGPTRGAGVSPGAAAGTAARPLAATAATPAPQACRAGSVAVEILSERRPTCSLKCSSLVQVVSRLDPSYEVVALLDADTIPHRTWLRELVAPFEDPRVGGATGNRWYMPAEAGWASLVRYLWNSAAVVQMFCYGIAWGGTLALRSRVFRESDLLERWGRAFCEDTMLHSVLARQGLRVAFVPSLMMVNREECRLGGFFFWLRRQLLAARLYHPAWPAVAVHGIGMPLLLAVAAGLLAVALAAGAWRAAAWVAAGLVLYQALLPVALAVLEFGVRRLVAARGEPTAWLRPGVVARIPLAILLTQAIYPASLFCAVFLRDVEWRGVRYRVDGSWRIRLTADCPHPPPAPTEAVNSL